MEIRGRQCGRIGARNAKVSGFGFYDLKGKGATDMWLTETPIELIQVLCGHESVKTTEVYVKCRWRGTVEPNRVRLTTTAT